MYTLILTNGEYGDYSFCKDIEQYDLVICADNGTLHAKHLGIIPDYILGDFDSSEHETVRFFEGKCKIEKFPKEKDETDTEIAIDRAIMLGAKKIDVFGGIGSRLDHTLGNVHLLYKALVQGVEVCLLNDKNEVRLIQHEITLQGHTNDLVSLIPFTEKVTGVTTSCLAYPLRDATFEMGQPYGISNYMLENHASISIQEGLLLVIKAID